MAEWGDEFFLVRAPMEAPSRPDFAEEIPRVPAIGKDRKAFARLADRDATTPQRIINHLGIIRRRGRRARKRYVQRRRVHICKEEYRG